MPNAALEEVFEATGYAKVIVAFKAPVADALAATTRMPGRSAARGRVPARSSGGDAGSLERDLAGYFIIPGEARDHGFALSAARGSARGGGKGLAPTPARSVRIYPRLALAIGYVDRAGAAALEADARVSEVVKAPELSLIRPVALRPVKAAPETSWGIRRLGVERLWDAGLKGKGVLIGHLDTGVDGKHPSLAGAVRAFAEFDFAGDIVPGAKPRDSDAHGTHTAGTIAGRPGVRGSFGVAPEASLASALVIEGGQVIDRILAGMEWVVTQGCRILSMSLGLQGFTPAFEVVIDALRAAGVLPVIAVGNEGPASSRSPGNYPSVVSVGAIADTDEVADFSGSQRFKRADDPLVPDLVAPGVSIISCVPGGAFAEMDGTSMATPHVAGLAALLLQAKPAATAAELEKAILGSCRRPRSMPETRGNRGVPDAAVAFKLLTGKVLHSRATASGSARKSAKARIRTTGPGARGKPRIAVQQAD